MLITDPLFYAIAIPVVLLTGISKTGIPGLFGGMAVPFLSLVIPPVQAAALMLPVLCFIDLFGLRTFRGIYDRRNMPILLAGLAIGVVLGMLVFTLVPRDFMRILIGTIAVAFALNNIFGWARNRPPTKASWPRGIFWSSLSGLTSFVAHAGSPPIMAYLLPQRLDRKIYVGTTVWFFFASNYAKLIPYAYLGQLDLTNLATAAVLLPFVPVGVKLGVFVQGKLDEKVFYQLSYWALLGIGLKLLYDGTSALWR
ncbi:MAG TPA: sulfite exporter TauE/SafE family protein [Casimicrobiaceae bacterium]|nr:sulfite exporter TauE/SafE family protein [Casimicrobiaceae bacterium]